MSFELLALSVVGIALLILVGALVFDVSANRAEDVEVKNRCKMLVERMRSHPAEAKQLTSELQMIQAAYRKKRRLRLFI